MAFDGSSTQQAPGGSSDCLLKPVAIFPDPGRRNAFLVMAEVLNADGTPHESNGRATIEDDDNAREARERDGELRHGQEHVLTLHARPAHRIELHSSDG